VTPDSTQAVRSARDATRPALSGGLIDELREITTLIAKLCKVEAALLMRGNDESMEVIAASQLEVTPYEQGEKAPREGRLYCETVLATGEALTVEDAFNDPVWAGNPDTELGLASYYGVPVSWPDGSPFGTLCILSRAARAPSSSDRAIISCFSRVVENVLKLITEEQRAVANLREVAEARDSLQFFKATLDQTPDCVLIFDAETLLITYVNRGAVEQLEYSREELLSLRPCDIEPLMSETEFRRLLSLIATGAQPVLNFTTVQETRNGKQIPVDVLIQYIAQQDKRPQYVAIVRDITEKKDTEDRLRAQERFLSTALDSVPLPIFYKDRQGGYSGVNSAFEAFLGKSRQELIGRTVFDIHPHDLAETYHAEDSLLLDSVGTRVYESSAITGSGERREIVFHKATLTDESGGITGLIGAIVDVTDRKRADAEIHRMAYYDALTGLPNRQSLQSHMDHALKLCGRTRRNGALIYLDLDDFKAVNDTRGHGIGDGLLVEVTRRIRATARSSDTVLRLGGDEFVVIVENLSEQRGEAVFEARAVADKIRIALEYPYALDSGQHCCTASLGIALFGADDKSVERLLRQADLAMYRAKASGRNTLQFFDPEMQDSLEARTALERDLRKALGSRELQPHYQPQVDRVGRVLGAELLLRWQHPLRGMIPPTDFIPTAEKTGMIVRLGRWILQQACHQIVAWSANPSMRHLRLSVNVSAIELRQADFVDAVRAVLVETGANPSQIRFELTESAVLDDINGALQKMDELKALGIGFELDDFGTGYSSLAYLTRLPLDTLKIDSSFVMKLPGSKTDAVIAQTIISMAKNLGLDVIAEGVETEGQRKFLAANECFTYQGFLFSRAVDAEALERYCSTSTSAEVAGP